MVPKLYEIYNAQLPYRNSNDIRPVIIIEVLSESFVTVALISGAMDLIQNANIHFRIESSDPDFIFTGLKKECYVAGDQICTIKNGLLKSKRGELRGELASRFSQWI